MTEPRIRDLLTFAEAERDAAPELAGELAELAGIALQVGATALHVRLTTLATAVGCKLELLDRILPNRGTDSEDTQPILIRRGREECSRCAGTGEVPAV